MPPGKKDVEPELIELKQFPKRNFQLKKHTDLTIKCKGKSFKCRGKTFHVHKLILSMKSGFFKSILDADTQSGNSKLSTISLDEDHPNLVQAMLQAMLEFYYLDDYDENTPAPDTGQPRPLASLECPSEVKHRYRVEKRLWFDIQLYSMAKKYKIEALKQAILQKSRTLVKGFPNQHGERGLSPARVADVAGMAFSESYRTDKRMQHLVYGGTMKNIDMLVLDINFTMRVDQLAKFWKQMVHFGALLRNERLRCPACSALANPHFPGGDGLRQCQRCGKIEPFDVWLAKSRRDSAHEGI
ncbi:hypothetical protein IWX90DRAFT_80174 [Phyllosticta citrichinensis]|uniref:BTB domain-containing protein n=1 Tax=Phyllosticta citrichinensis TaxID=1130410 RepID=A0ABR1XFT4_9PEZI